MKKLIAFMGAALLSGAAYAQDYSKILMLGTPTLEEMQTSAGTVDDDELAAYKWFMNHTGASYASASEIKNGMRTLDGFKAVWVVLDRELCETNAEAFANNLKNSGDAMFSTEVITALTNYYKGGGNLLLTNHASILLKETGRYSNYPFSLNAFNSDRGHANSGVFNNRTSYINLDPINDKSVDPLFAGIPMMTIENRFKIFSSFDGRWAEDHNCFFTLDGSGKGNDDTDKYAAMLNLWGVETLCVWENINDICSATITRWNPFGDYQGKAIAIGMGGYEWMPNAGENHFQYNIERLTANALSELSPGIHQVTDPTTLHEDALLYYDMYKFDHQVTELVTGNKYTVNGLFSEVVDGAMEGTKALRLDGYSSYVEGAPMPSVSGLKQMTYEVWCAAETYPMGERDKATEKSTTIAGSDFGSNGCKWDLSSRGTYQFVFTINGDWYFVPALTSYNDQTSAHDLFPKYQWNHLVAIVDTEAGYVKIYNNGVLKNLWTIPSDHVNGDITLGNGTMYIGRLAGTDGEESEGGCLMHAFNGIIDQVALYRGIHTEVLGETANNEAKLIVDRSGRFEQNIHYPRLHATPSANWGNEPHGIYFDESTGNIHMFYQKNANAHFISQQHWGHFITKDFFNWKEQKTALEPSEYFDWKGCWSGCMIKDNDYNFGVPTIFYTGVDNTNPRIIEATLLDPEHDVNLLNWGNKKRTYLADTEDCRDPYVFKHNGTFYMLIGRANDNHGAVCLHVFEGNVDGENVWEKNHDVFFEATGEGSLNQGNFWEMPVLTKIGNKYLFTVTTCMTDNDNNELNRDIRSLYWIGNLEGEGRNLRFVPDPKFGNAPKTFEIEGLSGYGHGVLSPSFVKYYDKTIAIGIVPDKLDGAQNALNGWSHNYSLPREISIDENCNLIQKPINSSHLLRLKDHKVEMTTDDIKATAVEAGGDISIPGGRMIDVDFTVKANSDKTYRFQFFKSSDGSSYAEINYNPATRRLEMNTENLHRINFIGNGTEFEHFEKGFVATVPQPAVAPTAAPRRAGGEESTPVSKLRFMVDHSNVDVFVDDQYASSMRIYPLNKRDISATFEKPSDPEDVIAINAYGTDPEEIIKNDPWTGIQEVETETVAAPEIKFVNGMAEFSGINGVAEVAIYSTTGMMKGRRAVVDGSRLDLSRLGSGIYIITLRSEKQTAALKVRL